MTYEIDIAGMKRDLKLCPVSDTMQIAAFIMYGDVEITEHAAAKLLEKAPEFDVILTAATKSIPLVYAMARQIGNGDYIVALKGAKVYMTNPIEAAVNSITTQREQTVIIGDDDAKKMEGKRVLIVDDVISTGESLKALEDLANKSGGNIVGKFAVLAEGDAYNRTDITVLGKLPLFDGEGNPL